MLVLLGFMFFALALGLTTEPTRRKEMTIFLLLAAAVAAAYYALPGVI